MFGIIFAYANYMIALTVKQPWAGQIARGEKTIEYRRWQTKYRGPLLICAAKPDGHAACIVDLIDCKPDPQSGNWLWYLTRPRPVEPLPVRGMPGLFRVEI